MNWHYFYVFFQANLIEVFFLLFFYRRLLNHQQLHVTRHSLAAALTVANGLTHPVATFVFAEKFLLGLAFTVTVEFLIHRFVLGLSYGRAFIGSLAANLLAAWLSPLLTDWLF